MYVCGHRAEVGARSRSADNRYILKTVTQSEVATLLRLLPAYMAYDATECRVLCYVSRHLFTWLWFVWRRCRCHWWLTEQALDREPPIAAGALLWLLGCQGTPHWQPLLCAHEQRDARASENDGDVRPEVFERGAVCSSIGSGKVQSGAPNTAAEGRRFPSAVPAWHQSCASPLQQHSHATVSRH